MSRHYLNVPFAQKDAAKALGARFDGAVKRWYVEAGTDLVPFGAWLPAGAVPAGSTGDLAVAGGGTGVALPKGGIPLSRLLGGVATAVAQAFASGVWTLVEVNEASVRNGHVYLELSERDRSGQPIARARAMIWAATAARILPDFEKATGAVIGAGIKLLVRARPVFSARYGLSLEIDAIDSEYTLGDLEARRKEIRARLRQEGLFDRNRQLPAPWDYGLVLVVAPQEAAGLGDFRKEAERLAQFGICRFVYAHSRFQGEGAGHEIAEAAAAALRAMAEADDGRPDAIVIIRGGGAVNDLAWLDDYALARFICEQDVPVLTGIGHERDNTLPDEVAHARFDTPSKVIAGIEQQIARRAREARGAWDAILAAAARDARAVSLSVERFDVGIRAGAQAHLAQARQAGTAALHAVSVRSVQRVHDASRRTEALLGQARGDAARALATARQQVPAWMNAIRADALAGLHEARSATRLALHTVADRTGASARAAARTLDGRMQQVAERSGGAVQRARDNAQGLMREIAGQGPEKTLTRGFAIVRRADGRPVTSSVQARSAPQLQIQFKDGSAEVRTVPPEGRK